MQVAKDSVVSVHYKLTLDSGELVDSSVEHGNPLVFIAGHGHIIPGLETSLMGLQTGDKKEVTVLPEEGYGVRDENLIQTVPRDQFPADIELRAGLPLSGQNEHGQQIEVVVKSFDEKEVILDLNHPLAGLNLNFDIEIMDVRQATPEEIDHGHVH